jgi:hypothetical protein
MACCGAPFPCWPRQVSNCTTPQDLRQAMHYGGEAVEVAGYKLVFHWQRSVSLQ